MRYATINGLPGFITRDADGLLQTTALHIEDGRIIAIYVVRNPDKLDAAGGADSPLISGEAARASRARSPAARRSAWEGFPNPRRR